MRSLRKFPKMARADGRWTHEETIGLANIHCAKCGGLGLMAGVHRNWDEPCQCVLRSIFRACLARFRTCEQQEPYRSQVTYVLSPGFEASASWTASAANFMADFYLIARRALEPKDFQIFRLHLLLGADWRYCSRLLGIDRGTFFHAVYRIEQQLGREYRDVRPYALWPVDEYFGGTLRRTKVDAIPVTEGAKSTLYPPLRKAA